jgi:putative alpha-1,2-mannosidase
MRQFKFISGKLLHAVLVLFFLPFRSINPGPQNRKGSHDGYNSNEPIRGFGQLHVSGTGWRKYGQIFF